MKSQHLNQTQDPVIEDLTIANNEMVTLIKGWSCSEEENCSDHHYITFCIHNSSYVKNEYKHELYILFEDDITNFVR